MSPTHTVIRFVGHGQKARDACTASENVVRGTLRSLRVTQSRHWLGPWEGSELRVEISVPEPLDSLCDYPTPNQEHLIDRTFWNNIRLHGLTAWHFHISLLASPFLPSVIPPRTYNSHSSLTSYIFISSRRWARRRQESMNICSVIKPFSLSGPS